MRMIELVITLGLLELQFFFSKLENCIVKDLYYVTISTKLIVNVIDLTSTQYKHCYSVSI